MKTTPSLSVPAKTLAWAFACVWLVALCMLVVAGVLSLIDAARANTGMPNVLIIVTDDLGHADATPKIDQIASGGVRFTQMHANPYCSPTRAALLTGSYAERVNIDGALAWNTPIGLPPTQRTIAEMLKEQGYATGLFGKWHLGQLQQYRPHHRFDRTFGVLGGEVDHFTHFPTKVTSAPRDWWDDNVLDTTVEYTTTAITREARQFIDTQQAPWFAYVAYTATHTPNQAPDGSISYGKQLAALDSAVLELTTNLPPNTLVWFVNDNGGLKANNNNLPLRGAKGTVYQGGIQVDSFLRWDGHIEPRLLSRRAHVMDIFPTLAGLLGLSPGRPVDGFDLTPEVTGGAWGPARDLFFATGNKFAYIDAPYKLVINGTAAAELFNLDNDPNETKNIAGANPTRVNQMRAAITNWRRDVGR